MNTSILNPLIDKIFQTSEAIRYVAIYQDKELISKQRAVLANTSSSESDKYEELFVNPTILKIAGQRGNLDCGGLEYIIVRYGNFYQMIREFGNGHISICVDKEKNPIDLEHKIKGLLEEPNNYQ